MSLTGLVASLAPFLKFRGHRLVLFALRLEAVPKFRGGFAERLGFVERLMLEKPQLNTSCLLKAADVARPFSRGLSDMSDLSALGVVFYKLSSLLSNMIL